MPVNGRGLDSFHDFYRTRFNPRWQLFVRGVLKNLRELGKPGQEGGSYIFPLSQGGMELAAWGRPGRPKGGGGGSKGSRGTRNEGSGWGLWPTSRRAILA